MDELARGLNNKATDIGHFRQIPDCHTAWSRILSVGLFPLYIIFMHTQHDGEGTA